jgi:hypothetical protein
MPPNYNHVKSQLSLGNGEILASADRVSWLGVGYLKGDGDVKFKCGYEIEPFKHGNPKAVHKLFNKESMMEVTAPLMQLSPSNLAMVLGGLSVQNSAGGSTNAPEYQATFVNWAGAPGLQAIPLRGPTVSSLTVKTTGDVTITQSGNWYLDSASGMLYRLPGGSITAGQTVKIAYTYVPPASDQINLGQMLSMADVAIAFRHPRNDGLIEIVMDSAVNLNPLEVDFGDKVNSYNVQWQALWNDTAGGSGRLGYMRWVYGATLQSEFYYQP